MNYTQKAKDLTDKILKSQGSNKLYASDKVTALLIVDEIIDALKITTGHCELKRLDLQEVQMDFDYWDKVKKEIESINNTIN